MKWLHNLRPRSWRQPILISGHPVSPSEDLMEPLELSALAELERKLDILTGEGSSQAALGKRAEAEVERFFGDAALHDMQSAATGSGDATIVLAADRLLVTFLGRRAAMAITRKLYSGTK